ncbi:MAG: histidine phosphatase family protein, partial [Acetatifactor sp.]|nr:histidine phosphatase family protein [Acetatifactor sp.]
MITFYIVRHGEILLNSLGRAQGWSDSPLTNNGKKAAMDLGLDIRGTIFRAAYASDTLRAV